jgi:competence protein ComEA
MFFDDYFCFSRSERNGTLLFAIILVLVYVFPYVYNALRGPAVYPADTEFINQINSLFFLNDSINKDTVRFTSQPDHRQIDSITPKFRHSGNKVIESYSTIDINSADTATLMQIRGIGEVLSRRIIRYRDILGGYSDLQQLREVYGIDEERFNEILPYLSADTLNLIRINVNTDEFRLILRHPYLDFQQVSQLFRLRDNQLIVSPRDLLQLPAFSETDIKRLRPYLSF